MHCKNKWKILWSIKYTCTNKKKKWGGGGGINYIKLSYSTKLY